MRWKPQRPSLQSARVLWTRGLSWARYLLDPRFLRDIQWPPLKMWLLLLGFITLVIGSTVALSIYSARARNVFVRIGQAAVLKYTGYQVFVGETSVEAFPPRVTLDGVIVRRPNERPFFTAARIRFLPGITRSLSGNVALEWLEVRSPELKLTYRNGVFEELRNVMPAAAKPGGTPTKLPFELWGALITRARVQVNLPGRALVEVRGLNLFAAPRATGSIPVEIMVPPISVELPNRRVVLEDIHMGLQVRGGNLLAPKKVQLRTFEFISEAGSLQTQGLLDLDKKEGSLSVRTNIDLDILNLIDPALPAMSGRVGVRAEIDAEKEVPMVNLEVDGSRVSIGERVVGDLHAELGASMKQVEVKKLVLRAALGELVAQGHLVPAGEHPFDAELSWTGLELASIIELAGMPDVWPSLRMNGKAKVSGRLRPKKGDPTLTGSARIDVREFVSRDRNWREPTFLTILRLENVVIETKLALFAEHLDLNDAHVRGEAGQIDCDVRFNFDQHQGFHITGRSDALDLKKLGRIGGIAIEGVGPLHFELGGPYGPPRIDAEISLADTKIAGLPLGHVDSRVLLQDAHTLEFPDAVATLGDTTVEGKGALDFQSGPSLAFSGSLAEGAIQDLLPIIPLPAVLAKSLVGDVGGEFHLSGLAAKPTLEVSFASDAFEALGQPFETAIGKVTMKHGAFEHMELDARVGGGAVDLRLDGTPRGVAATAILSDIPTRELRFLQGAREVLDGAMNAHVEATLGDVPEGEGSLEIAKLSIAGRPSIAVNGRAWLHGDEIRFDASAMDGHVAVHGKADIGEHAAFELEGSLQRARVGELLGLPVDYEVLASGAVVMGGPFASLDAMHGELQLDRVSIDSATMSAATKQRATLSLAEKRLNVEGVEISGRGLELQISGFVALDGKLNLGLQGRVDGGVLQPVVPTLELLVGTVPLDVRLLGALGAPELRGEAKLDDLRLKFGFLDKSFEHLSGLVTLQGDTFVLDDLSASFGDGDVKGSGSLRLADSELKSLSFAFDLDDVHYLAPGDLPVVVAGRLRVDENRAKQFEVTGDVRVKELRYTYDLSLDAMMPSFKRKPTQTRTLEKSDERVLFDVHIRAGDNLIVDNNVAKAELKADLRLTGTNLRTGLLGTVTPLKASVSFQNHTYTLTSGSVDFVERYQILPRVDLVMHTSACAAEITVTISGTADNYALDFRGRDANGSVRQEDIQSCLAFGFRQSEFTSGAGVSRATAGNEVLPIGLNLLGTVTGIDRKLKEYFRIDEVRFTAGYTSRVGRGSRVTPLIVVAKDIGGGVKLRLTSSLLDTDNQKLELIFPIADFSTANLSWGNYGDLSNDLGFDLKWHKDF